MTDNFFERRLEIVKRIARGERPTEIVGALSQQFHISVRQAWTEWEKRKEWLPKYSKSTAAQIQETRDDLILTLQEARRRLFETADKSTIAASKVRALRAVQESVKSEIEFRQSLGLLPSPPLQIKHSGEPAITVKVWRPEEKKDEPAAEPGG